MFSFLLSLPANQVIKILQRGRITPLPDTKKAQKALNPALHAVNNPALRRDKLVHTDSGEHLEKVARIALPLQELIIKRAVAFLFGEPVTYLASPQDDTQKQMLSTIEHILTQAKENSLNRRIARAVFSFGECAELWYPEPLKEPSSAYGFPCAFKLRCALFSPAFGDTLYPYFNQVGDMVAFSRAYRGERLLPDPNLPAALVDYFETYTAENHYLWMRESDTYHLVEGYPKPISIGKIPVVYAAQEHLETEQVDPLIDRLEHLLSNFAETNDYHASPKIFVTGTINGWSQKGEAGAVIEGDKDASMQYISWHNAPESVKLEMDTLLRMIYTLTQTPDISFDNMRGMGNLSGVALKLLFLDAQLKVQDKREIFDQYLLRRISILKAYLAQMHTPWRKALASLEVIPQIHNLLNENK